LRSWKEKQKNVGYDFIHRTGRKTGSGHTELDGKRGQVTNRGQRKAQTQASRPRRDGL
jgi:hypothetical protein